MPLLLLPLPIRMPLLHPLRLLSPTASGIAGVPDPVPCGQGCLNYMALWDQLEKKRAPSGWMQPLGECIAW